MESNDFFSFDIEYAPSIIQAGAVGLKKDENGISAHSRLIKGEYTGIEFPVIFKQEYGKKNADILGTGWTDLFLISDQLKKLLESNNLTGWTVYPIELYDKKNNEIFGYHGFSVVGRCQSMNCENSQIIEKRFISEGPTCKYYKGKYFDLNKWDKSDFFTPLETGGIFITEKVAIVLKQSKLNNIRLVNLKDIETNVTDIKKH